MRTIKPSTNKLIFFGILCVVFYAFLLVQRVNPVKIDTPRVSTGTTIKISPVVKLTAESLKTRVLSTTSKEVVAQVKSKPKVKPVVVAKPKVKKVKAKPTVTSYSNSKSYNKDKLVEWVMSENPGVKRVDAEAIVREVLRYERPLLKLSIIHTESRFKKRAVSSKRAVGLGQITSVHHPKLKKLGIIDSGSDLYRIKPNVAATSYVFEKYYGESGCVDSALRRYSGNARGYARKVRSTLSEIKRNI